MKRVEIIPGDRVIWQSDKAKTYQCPVCMRPVFSQYEGDDLPAIVCEGAFGNVMGAHRLTWDSEIRRENKQTPSVSSD
jgi:hypothetical protein